jgi:RNA polymerase sigma-70 factor, ECF subfamily
MHFEEPTGQERVLRRWLDDHLGFVARALRSAGTPPAEVDDAVQRTFIIAARRQDDVRVGAERSFLLQIALNVAAHVRRSLARRREAPESELPESVDVANPEQLTLRKHDRQLVDRAIEHLTPELREVFVLFEIEERTTAEIAEQLRIPTGTVASRLRRAREQFRERLRTLTGRKVAAAALGAGSLAASARANASSAHLFGQLGMAKALLIGLSATAVVAVPVVVSRRLAVSAPVRVVSVVDRNRLAQSSIAERSVSEPSVSAPSVAGASIQGAPAAGVGLGGKVAVSGGAPSRPASSAESLRGELAQLDAARSRLAGGEPEQALGLLDAYDRATPRGALKLEAEVMRIDALSRSGRSAQAKQRAQAFLRRYPESVLAARVRRIVGT